MSVAGFEVVDGRQTVTGEGVIRVDQVKVNHEGSVSSDTILSNGRAGLYVVMEDDYLSLYTRKGRRSILMHERTRNSLVFYIDGEYMQTISIENADEFRKLK